MFRGGPRGTRRGDSEGVRDSEGVSSYIRYFRYLIRKACVIIDAPQTCPIGLIGNKEPMQTLVITRPDDWHLHLRDGDILLDTVLASAKHFARALVMPNLKPPLTTLAALEQYRHRIISALPAGSPFTPYMTLYLNESIAAEALIKTAFVLGAKFYPAGATTHSEAGAKSIKLLYPLLELMQANDLVLQIHGEVTHSDIFERESLFIEDYLIPLMKDFPKLRIVLEHISTKKAVDFVSQAPDTLAATITPHHLLYNRNHLLASGIKPHFYCLPILKKESDQIAIQQAAISANPKFFAGTDSAPHEQQMKESACGCAGIYSAPYALALYAQVFDKLGYLPRLNDFCSRFGAAFYGLPILQDTIELRRQAQRVPQTLSLGKNKVVVPIAANEIIDWSVHVPA
jgi:dihydroorotase